MINSGGGVGMIGVALAVIDTAPGIIAAARGNERRRTGWHEFQAGFRR